MNTTRYLLVHLLTSLVLVVVTPLTLADETKNEPPNDESESAVVWTYTPELEILRDEWIDQGKADLPISSIPSTIVEKYGISSETVGPEIFFSNEVQNLMVQLMQEGGSWPGVFTLAPTEENMEFLNSIIFTDSIELGNICGTMALIDDWNTFRYTNNERELPKVILDTLDQLYNQMLFINEELSSKELHQFETYRLTFSEATGAWTLSSKHTEEQATKAFDALNPKQQELLREFTDILQDRSALFGAMIDMSKQQILATLEFLTILDSSVENITGNPTLPPKKLSESPPQEDQRLDENPD